MKTNLIIGSEDLASKILLSKFPVAQLFPNNSAKMYLIGYHLSDYRGYYHISRLWVWGVKCGKNNFGGLIFNSGIISDYGNEINNGVFVSFVDSDILTEEGESLNRREIRPGITLRIDNEGKQYLEQICYPDNISAEAALKKLYPDLKFKGRVIMIQIGEPKRMKTYWVVLDKQKCYRGVSPFDGEKITLPRGFPFYTIKLGDHAGKGYYLRIRAKKLILTRKKAT